MACFPGAPHGPSELLLRRRLILSTLPGPRQHCRNAAVTSFLLPVTSQALALSRPPACHWHLASNSSRFKPVLSRHTMPATAEQSSHRRMRWLKGGRAQVARGKAGSLSHSARWPRPHCSDLGAPTAHPLEKILPDAVGVTSPADTNHVSKKLEPRKGSPSIEKRCLLELPITLPANPGQPKIILNHFSTLENHETERSPVFITHYT